MPKRKPKPPRIRQSAYERALTQATARLAKAITERDQCSAKLMALNLEIPKLQTMITGIHGFIEKAPMPLVNPTTLKAFMADVAAKPRDIAPIIGLSTNVDDLPDEADQFLSEPDGQEVLPGYEELK